MNIEFKLKFNVVTFLLVINLVIFGLAFYIDHTLGFDNSLFYLFGGQISSQIKAGDWWLLVTANFFHIELIHFVLNAVSLYQVGHLVEYYYEGKKIFLTYVLGGIGGVWLSYVVSIFTHQNTFSLGASASIFALIGLLIGGTFRRNRFGRDLPFSLRDILPFVLFAFVFGLIPGLNVNNWAHLGGILTGIILGFIIPNSLVRVENKFEIIITKLLFWISVLIFIASYAALLINAYNLLIK